MDLHLFDDMSKDLLDCASMVEELGLLIVVHFSHLIYFPSINLITFVFSHCVNPVRKTLLSFLYTGNGISVYRYLSTILYLTGNGWDSIKHVYRLFHPPRGLATIWFTVDHFS